VPKVSEAHLEARRRQILDAALICFGERGFHATSMRDICREAELSAGAVYRYFESKEDLIAGIAELEIEPLLAMLRDLEPEARIKAAIHQLFDHPELDQAMRVEVSLWAEALTNPRIAELMRAQLEPMTATVTDAIAELQDSGRIREPSPPRVIAERLRGGLLGGMLQACVLDEFDLRAYLQSMERSLLGDTD